MRRASAGTMRGRFAAEAWIVDEHFAMAEVVSGEVTDNLYVELDR
jgi:hypothetical protein